jgi:hypothetical protein
MLSIVMPPPGTGIYKIVAVLIAFGLATATYLYIERPVRKPPYTSVKWLVTGSAVCLLCGIAVFASAGFARQRGPWNVQSVPDPPKNGRLQTDLCDAAHASAFHPRLLRERDFCIKDGPGVDDVVVVGDSHANRLFFGL